MSQQSGAINALLYSVFGFALYLLSVAFDFLTLAFAFHALVMGRSVADLVRASL